MDPTGQQHTPPSDQDGDGVRVVAKPRGGTRSPALFALLALVLVAAGVAWLMSRPTAQQRVAAAPTGAPAQQAGGEVSVAAPMDPARTALRDTPALAEVPNELRSLDPTDLAAHVRPGDPEPTAAEVIEALRHAGIHSGIAAFNPPGTSPPLPGLAAPEDIELPEGYVRHHQVTDGGEPIEPILMFSPDYDFHDAQGRPIALPENRVVPPELAPPGFPIRQVEIPTP
ncbi:MAG: hypothetical protein M3Q42_12835 [Pseudomonadota bacterium]|nr:hypothetical protein [Pseudomonadota bacterium]